MPLSRRQLLKVGAVAGAGAVCGLRLRGGEAAVSPAVEAILEYLETLRREDGGYGWAEREISHLTPTLAAIGCYRLLGRTPPRVDALIAWTRRGHPSEIKKLEQERRIYEYQQVQALVWLGADAAALRPRIAALTQPLAYLKQYERHGYPIFQSELGVVLAHALLGLPRDGILEPFGRYLEVRRRENGSFNNTPSAEGGDGHVMNTLWALQALPLLGRGLERREALIGWLRACQRPEGGFTYAPRPEFGGVDDIAYTRAALRSLQILGAAPAERDACLTQIHSLANADGGFGDRPGWLSNAMATFCALDALDALGALGSLARVRRRAPRLRPALPHDLKVFTIQVEAHGQGSPADAVELARGLKIDLWAAKNARPGWRERAQAIADRRGVPVRFVVGNEEYGTWLDVPGLGTYSHASDLMAPGDTDIGASLTGAQAVTWPEFRARRLEPLQRGRGRLFWQFGENEELVRVLLDDSVERGGFAAISTFHFGNPDFTNTEPFLQRWRGRIPFIALHDAHGPEPWWWGDQLTGFRTLFLAPDPTWDAWLRALERNWVAAVRRDVWTQGRTWMHTGSDEVRDFVRAHEPQWRWWENPAIARPLVSVVVVRPEENFEAGRPERGIAVRVRCAWENTAQGLPKTPLAELLRLDIDGREVTPEVVGRKRGNGQTEEHYHLWRSEAPTPGPHSATATVRVRATGAAVAQTTTWSVA